MADHVWQHPIMGGPETPQIEAYTTLGFIAAPVIQRVHDLSFAPGQGGVERLRHLLCA